MERSRQQEAIAEQFRSISEQNMQASVFKALVERVSQQRQSREMKANLKEYAAELYIMSLTKKAFRALQEEKQLAMQKVELSRVYAIFQAWRCLVKESALLKKYLNEADDTFTREDNFQAEESKIEYQNSESSPRQCKSLFSLEEIGLGSTSKFVTHREELADVVELLQGSGKQRHQDSE